MNVFNISSKLSIPRSHTKFLMDIVKATNTDVFDEHRNWSKKNFVSTLNATRKYPVFSLSEKDMPVLFDPESFFKNEANSKGNSRNDNSLDPEYLNEVNKILNNTEGNNEGNSLKGTTIVEALAFFSENSTQYEKRKIPAIYICPEKFKNTSKSVYDDLPNVIKSQTTLEFVEKIIFTKIMLHEFAHGIMYSP